MVWLTEFLDFLDWFLWFFDNHIWQKKNKTIQVQERNSPWKVLEFFWEIFVWTMRKNRFPGENVVWVCCLVAGWFGLLRSEINTPRYTLFTRARPLALLNILAKQAETWKQAPMNMKTLLSSPNQHRITEALLIAKHLPALNKQVQAFTLSNITI